MVQVLPVSQSLNFPSSAGPNQSPASLATPLPSPSDTTLITTKRSVNTGAQGCQYLNYCSGKGQCVGKSPLDSIKSIRVNFQTTFVFATWGTLDSIALFRLVASAQSMAFAISSTGVIVWRVFFLCLFSKNRQNSLGWTGKNCSTPICRDNCTNNGKCIDRNKCECNPGWKGRFTHFSCILPIFRGILRRTLLPRINMRPRALRRTELCL